MDAISASGMESADKTAEHPPGSIFLFDVPVLASIALDRLQEAGIPGSGQTCSLSSFRQFLQRLSLPENADISSIQAVQLRIQILDE